MYGKIKSIAKSNGDSIIFAYDALGNRIMKNLKPASGPVKATFYVRDAQGSDMGIYERTVNNNLYEYRQTEAPIYGSERLGQYRANVLIKTQNLDGTPATCLSCANKTFWTYDLQHALGIYTRPLNKKVYELKDHLGNVRTTFSDQKLSNGTAQELSYSNYYAFGSPLPGRTYNSSSYRYGFNGQEKDDEISGSGNSLDFGERIYDSRLGKFLSVDKLTSSFPWWSPYAFAGNTPIQAIDLDGLEIYYSQSGQKIGTYGTSTEIRVINEDQLTTATTEFAIYTNALKTDPAATNTYLGSTLATTGSVAYNDYFTNVTDVTGGAALETYGNNGANCFAAANKQLSNEGVTQTGPAKAIQTKVDNATQTANGKPTLTENAIGGSIYIQTQLNKGNPVMVGIEEQNSAGNTIGVVPNNNALTGHFVVINSSSVDANGNVTFGYLDNASSRCGTNSGNQFSLDKTTGSMTDTTSPCTGGVSSYEVSEVRKNK